MDRRSMFSGRPRRTALAQFLALALLASLTSGAEVRLDFVSSDPAHSIPTAEGWALFGSSETSLQ